MIVNEYRVAPDELGFRSAISDMDDFIEQFDRNAGFSKCLARVAGMPGDQDQSLALEMHAVQEIQG
ncbi:hypothetical protein D3C76_1404780 [compost metagenome]